MKDAFLCFIACAVWSIFVVGIFAGIAKYNIETTGSWCIDDVEVVK